MSSESKPVGQDIDSKIRTIDVEIDRNVSFEQLMLSPTIIAGKSLALTFHTSEY